MVECRIISIGALAAHPLRGEKGAVRPGHGTTVLVDDGSGHRLLIDPALPGEILEARLFERAGLTPSDITHVFLTSFLPDVRRGLLLFANAVWWISEREREAVGVALVQDYQRLENMAAEDMEDMEDEEGGGVAVGGDRTLDLVREEIALLQRMIAAPDQLFSGVDLFPLPGRTPGLSGLIISKPSETIIVCGDAVATIEHLNEGKVLPDCYDIEQAQESFRDALEIADQLVLGRDNMVNNPVRGMF